MSFETNLYHPMKNLLIALTLGLGAASCAATDLMSADDADAYARLELELDGALADQDYARAAQIEERLVEMEDLAAAPYVEGAQSLISDFVPAGPWKPLALGAAALASRVFTRRGRRHLAKGARSAAKLALPDTIRSVGAALGYGSGSAEDAEQSLRDAQEREVIRTRGRHTAAVTEDMMREAIAVAVATALSEARSRGHLPTPVVPDVESGSEEDAAAGGGEMA